MPRLKNVHKPATDLIAPTSLSTLNMMEAAPWARVLLTLLIARLVIALGPSSLNPLTTATHGSHEGDIIRYLG